MDKEEIEKLIKDKEHLFKDYKLVNELIEKSKKMVENKIEKAKLDNDIERIIKKLKGSD